MRAYPTDSLNFLETVQVYFLEVTGKGVVLGSRDAELLQLWRAQGATAASICQGIDDAVRARGELPRSIAGCRKWIEPRVEAARALRVGHHEQEAVVEDGTVQPNANWAERVLDRIENAGRNTDRETFRDAFRDAYRELKDGLAVGEDLTTLVLKVDRKLGEAFVQALTPDERSDLRERIESSPQMSTMGEQARQSFIEARTRRLLESEYGLIQLFS